MAVNSYKPKAVSVNAISPKSNIITSQKLTTALWSHILLNGTAKLSGGGIVTSAAVLVWTITTVANQSIANAFTGTFTDNQGRYAVTVPTSQKLTIRVYS
ncbi:hypothetical protein CHF27_008725 [Romboutsia maritimum]|uniref:Carboxypeptidase regulatory-like domain-containing protein n=1 Tax=Romboutsia maritimum TaxID=2020948 RepID=A0A371IS67_9FIRM|nr:hypothetical protein [Romboutsia maritimum]RDY23321.1 hypothetical protein CHF27_008725 [Romboutsia maritimum]